MRYLEKKKVARKVGKTWLMKEFGRRYFKNTAYINFDNNPRMKQVFEEDYASAVFYWPLMRKQAK